MEVTLNGYYTLILATLVLLLGRFLVKKIKFLEDFNIPEPVAGGLVAATIVYALNLVWGYDFVGDSKIVDVNIRRLRSKIEVDSSKPHYIETVWGIGYRWRDRD